MVRVTQADVAGPVPTRMESQNYSVVMNIEQGVLE